ncbi:hypothetical protein, partial [Salmonella enterica]|uniref:hypothetical protein n=1 Tax=Salmonella enterica TaxID=28901 RepID=UPI003D2B2893
TSDEALTRKFDADVIKARTEVQKMIDQGMTMATPETRPLWDQLRARWGEWLPVNDQVRELANANRNAEAGTLSIGKSRELAMA